MKESLLTGAVQVSDFLKAKLLKNNGEPFRFLPQAKQFACYRPSKIQK